MLSLKFLSVMMCSLKFLSENKCLSLTCPKLNGIRTDKSGIVFSHHAEGITRVCLFDLILYVQSTIFQLNRDGSSWVEPVLS